MTASQFTSRLFRIALLLVAACLTASAKEKSSADLPKEIYTAAKNSFPEPARTVLDFDDTTGGLDPDSVRAVVWLKFKLDSVGRAENIDVAYSSHPDHGLEYRAVHTLKSARFQPVPIINDKAPRWFYHEVVFDRGLFREMWQSYGDSAAVIDSSEYLPKPDEFVPVEIMPEMIKNVVPEYPASAKSKGATGVVWVKCLVDRKGLVRETLLGKTSGNPDLDKAAVSAAYKNRFKPALQNGQPVACWVTYRVKFE